MTGFQRRKLVNIGPAKHFAEFISRQRVDCNHRCGGIDIELIVRGVGTDVAKRIRHSTGDDSTSLPADTTEWIVFLSGHIQQAPEGGPAFVASTVGSSGTGAIGVSFERDLVVLTQPRYLDLEAHQVEVVGFEVREVDLVHR